MADAIALGAASALSRVTLSVVDDEPVTYATLFRHIATIGHGPEPQSGGPPTLPSFRVTNARARASLGWVPRIATYRAGLV
jgi:nucleoside-diphosphate-sugar epimerase